VPDKICGKGRQGFVLVIVLWLIALLTIMAMGLGYSSRQSVRSMGGLVGGTQARYLAEGGVQLVLMNLLSRQSEDRLLGDSELIAIEMPNGFVELMVSDESGKVDINAASSELLARLFTSFDLRQEDADALADAVIDFRDEDDLESLNGAEDEQYRSAGLPWEAKDAAFSHVEELRQVYGMPHWLFKAILPYVTIYNRDRGVNPEVASLQVLMALSDDTFGTLETYIRERRENYLAGLALPEPPYIDSQFIARSRGVTFSITATGKTPSNQQASITTTVRLKRSRDKETIETLNWMPYRLHTVAAGTEHASLPGEHEPESTRAQ
jgi:general secretion pathway protein K